MVREEILNEAEKCVCTDRNQQYGEPEDNFSVIAQLWEPYIRTKCVNLGADVDVSAEDVANMMVLFKVGRAATANEQKADTYIDIAGYAACAGEIATGKPCYSPDMEMEEIPCE